jgi:cation transporter-like permease
MIIAAVKIAPEEVLLEPNKKRSNVRTVLVMALIFIFVLGVLAYVSGVVINLSALASAPETTIILISSLVGLSFAAVVALIRLSKEDR